MPKVVSYTPSWLSHPAPGARIFSDPEKQSPASPSKKRFADLTVDHAVAESDRSRPRRIIAHRGSEVFTVVGNKIRWADLVRVREDWEAKNHRRQPEQSEAKVYRTLTTQIYYEITNLSVSPSGHFLAISTEHAIWIAFLPDSARLHDQDSSDIKLKTLQLGRTTHVIPEAPLASVLWHPFAAASATADCLVTVTTDAAVRVWELQRSSPLSFDRPSLAIDLRKLANGTSSDQDFEPGGFGRNRAFSVDALDMEVAAACFGGRGLEAEDPWGPMTLWVAMTNADVYALCPLLPERWTPTPTTIPALTTSTVAQIATLADEDDDPDESRAVHQRYEWVQELDNEILAGNDGHGESVRLRPSNPSAIPRLQGPFELHGGFLDDDAEIADIFVIPANLDEDELFSGEDDYEVLGGARSLPFSVICLTTSANQLHVLLELEGVYGQWLPKKGRSHFSVPTGDAGECVLLETVLLGKEPASGNAVPVFTVDPANPYNFYITTGTHILSLSLDDWASRVGSEVSEDIADGLESRLKLACRGTICQKHDVLTCTAEKADASILSAAVFVEDATLGSLLLSSYNGRAVAALLDQSSYRTSQLLANEPSTPPSNASPFRTSQSLMKIVQSEADHDLLPIRAPYAPAQAFYRDQSASLDEIKARIPAHRRAMLTDRPLRLSPACLDIMTLAHRTFSHQTSVIEKAAGELFRRCLRLREELADQVKAMAEIAGKLNDLRDHDEDGDGFGRESSARNTQSQNFSDRIEAAKARQKELYSRYERVRRKAGHVGQARHELSVNEKMWIEEIENLADHVAIQNNKKPQEDEQSSSLTARLAEAQALMDELLAEAKAYKENSAMRDQDVDRGNGTPRSRLAGNLGMSRFQREKIREVMEMVEREAAIIEAVQGRLARLTVAK